MIDYTVILNRKFKGAIWTLNGDFYEGLEWLDKSSKPTQEELDALWPTVQQEIEAEIQTKEETRTELLTRLGITAQELSVLLA